MQRIQNDEGRGDPDEVQNCPIGAEATLRPNEH